MFLLHLCQKKESFCVGFSESLLESRSRMWYKNFKENIFDCFWLVLYWNMSLLIYTVQKMKLSITDFFSKCEKILKKPRIWSHLPKKSVIENFIFCAVIASNTFIIPVSVSMKYTIVVYLDFRLKSRIIKFRFGYFYDSCIARIGYKSQFINFRKKVVDI